MGKTPPGPLAESALRRQGDDNFPAVTIIKLPFVIEPMVPNPSILGLQMHNTPLHGQPAVKMFDMLGRILLTDPTTAELPREFHFFWTVVPDLSGMPPRYSTVNDLKFLIRLSSIYWKANSRYCTVRWLC